MVLISSLLSVWHYVFLDDLLRQKHKKDIFYVQGECGSYKEEKKVKSCLFLLWFLK